MTDNRRTERTSLNSPGSNRVIATVTGCEKLNVRSGPSLDDKILKVISNGDAVTVLDQGYGEWTKIVVAKQEGYVVSRYITGVTSNGQYTGNG